MCAHTLTCGAQPELSICCLRQLIGQGRLGRALRTPLVPLTPALTWNAINRLSLRLQTKPARICLLRPSRSPGLGVELPEGMAFTGRPGRVLPVLGGGATAVDKAPGAHASSPS